MDRIKIKAPATVANLSCGFDVLGLCLDNPFDEIEVIKIATKDERVTRIFVNPLIKKELCVMAEEKNDMDWLKKMRPWAGQYNHFHVRLSWPKNSELCINQADVNNSSGCGSELDFWMKKDKLFESNSTKIRKWMLLSDLPKSCRKISME